MSKYVSTRLEKINKLSKELEEFNIKINSYICILKKKQLNDF